jgi:hypothetical protein
MKDMIGQEISVGDVFIIPGGNVRFGGLVLEFGIVLSKTEKMLKTTVTRLDKIKLKPTNKTPRKVLKIDINSHLSLHPAIQELLKVLPLLNEGAK